MNSLYESFMTEFIRKNIMKEEVFSDYSDRPQSKGIKKYLRHQEGQNSRHKLLLQPDILIERYSQAPADTDKDRAHRAVIDIN